MDIKPKAIVIAGPTASGKTEVAIKLASYFSGEIINADSMQVYKEMDIGTAKPGIKERERVPHHLIDIVNPDEEFNAAMYRERALPLIYEIYSRGKACFIVGGTGLYIRALLGGLFYVPQKDPRLRKKLIKEISRYGLKELYKKLMDYDSDYAKKVHPNDRIRIIRGLEIFYLTGKKPSELIKAHRFRDEKIEALKLFLYIDRQELYERINKRSLKMIESGLIEETRKLLLKGYSPNLKSMQSIGYKHMVKYIKGEWSLNEALRIMQRDTRRYAKRQITWFKKEPNMIWISAKDIDSIKRRIADFLDDSS